MHFDIHFRTDVANKIRDVVEDIHTWNIEDEASLSEIEELSEYVQGFEHCPVPDHQFFIGGADGSGDFPCVCYGDSVVYLVTAMSRLYATSPTGLVEKDVSNNDIVDFLWLPEDKEKARAQYLDFFAQLIGESLESICEKSDYYQLARSHGGRVSSPIDLIDTLITPPAHESDNIGIQLLNTAEAGALIRLMRSLEKLRIADEPVYLLEDTTMSLPLLDSRSTLFFEIAKRYACKVGRDSGVSYFTISKSHNMPHMDLIEDMIKRAIPSGEHWFMRLPISKIGEKKLSFLGARTVPPVGAVTYLFKLHKNTQPMRLDMDFEYWDKNIRSEDKEVMSSREKQIFRDLDFASHDQRCYGYPYPIKACHDMVSLTKEERVALRKQIVDEAVKAGLKRKNFVDPSILTGHA